MATALSALWGLRAEHEQRLLYAPDPETAGYDAVLSVTFSSDGTLLVSTNDERTPDRAAYVWYVRIGELIHCLGGFRYRIHAAALSPDRHVLALAGDGCVVTLRDAAVRAILAYP